MDIDYVLNQFRRELRELAWAGDTLEQSPRTTRRLSPGRTACEVEAFDLDDDQIEASIREEVTLARERGVDLEWKVFSFDHPALIPRLEEAGFTVNAREALVLYDVSNGLEGMEAAGLGQVQRVDRLEMLEDYKSVAAAAFGKEFLFTAGQLAEAIRSGEKGHDAYIAYADGMPASVGRLYTNPASAFAGLYGGGTAPEFRGRGLYRAVVAARAKDAVEAGARYLQVDALPTSLPILLRLGFVHVADTWPVTLAFKP